MNSASPKSRTEGVFSKEFLFSYVLPVTFLLALGLSIVLLEWLYSYSGQSFSEGKPAPKTYRALASMKYPDITATNKLRNIAENSVAGVMIRDIGAPERLKERLDELKEAPDLTSPKVASDLTPELLRAFMALPEDRRQSLFLFAKRVGDAYFEKTASGDIASGLNKALLWAEIDRLKLESGEANLLYQLLTELIDPSYKLDKQLTTLVKDRVKEGIPAVERSLVVGDVIVEAGQIITPQIAGLLRLQGYSEDRFPLKQLVIVCMLMLVLPLWLEIPAREAGSNRPSWTSIVFVIAIGWVCQAVAAHLNAAGAGILASIAVAYLCMPRRFAFNVCLVGVVSGVFLITGLSIYNLLLLLISGFVAAMAGYYALRHIGSREDLAFRVFGLAFFLALTKITIRSFQGFALSWASLNLKWPMGETWTILLRSLLFDLGTTFLMVSILPLIEGYIGVLSVLRARELSHPSNPLLKKLQVEAPGTYHHCLMIGTLAEAVAHDLGMDENIMKIGAYYHDIGKLRRPRYFVENQMGGENIHDTMSPTLSAVAILAHVRDGVELANEFRMPKKVKQFITEHHGTTSLNYFYKKALARGENVDLEQFCYPGPKPQSKETALLMLLDSSEAAMRAESKNITTIDDIREVIDRVFALKIAEGQLDEADFTLKEIAGVKKSLLKAFQSMYHTRKVKDIKEVANAENTTRTAATIATNA